MVIKKIFKNITPPILVKLIRKKTKYGFFGDYKSWQEAEADSTGYNNAAILEKVKNSLLKVKKGEVAYERDSVLFDKVEHSWPVLAGLLWIASLNNNRLNVLDFGGSLGSSYFQNLDFLKHLEGLRWNIVEQNNFVECGKKYFENSHLKFYLSIEECLKDSRPNVFLSSSVIQYLEKPYEFLEKISKSGFEYLIFDRVEFLKNKDRLTVQKVRPEIYDASYPAWFLNEEKFLGIIKKNYEPIADFDSIGGKILLGKEISFAKGFLFRRSLM